MKIVATNKKAYHDYFILDTLECGIVLEGCEVKSVRQGNVNLKDSFCSITSAEEVFVKNMHIKTYEKASFLVDEKRNRKLLLNKHEIRKLHGKIKQNGFTLVPLKVYFKDSLVKLEIGLAKGKHTYDKKATLKEKDIKRDTDRLLKNR